MKLPRHWAASMFEGAAWLLRLAPQPRPLPRKVETVAEMSTWGRPAEVTDEVLDRLSEIGERAPKAPK